MTLREMQKTLDLMYVSFFNSFRTAWGFALVPHFICSHPGRNFELYLDMALLATNRNLFVSFFKKDHKKRLIKAIKDAGIPFAKDDILKMKLVTDMLLQNGIQQNNTTVVVPDGYPFQEIQSIEVLSVYAFQGLVQVYPALDMSME